MPPKKATMSNIVNPSKKVTANDTATKSESQIVQEVKMKQVTPREMEKLQNLKRWPIIMDEVEFNPDGSINDHRQYTIPLDANRLLAVIMVDNPIEKCIDDLKQVCGRLHPDLFDTVFGIADVKESGRNDLDRLFVMTQTPDHIRNEDYYQFGAKNRSTVPFTCIWITHLTEIPQAYDHLFGPRFKLKYD